MSLSKIEEILKQIKQEQEPISGGSGKVERYSMRKPELYWELGLAVKEEAEKTNIPKEQRREWARRKFEKLDKKFFGKVREKPICFISYEFYNEFQNKEHFLKVANAAGHKFGKLRRKRIEDLQSVLSLREPTISKKKQQQLIEKLCERDYTRAEFLDIKSKIQGKESIPWSNFREAYYNLTQDVEMAITGDEKVRKELRTLIGMNSIDQIRYLTQLVKMTNVSHLEEAIKKVKSTLSKKGTDKPPAGVLLTVLKKCYKEKKLREKLLRQINPYELSELQTKLRAIQNEDSFDEYQERQESINKMFQ